MIVRVGGALSDFVATNVGDEGSYENVRECIRDLIRRDKERAGAETFAAVAWHPCWPGASPTLKSKRTAEAIPC